MRVCQLKASTEKMQEETKRPAMLKQSYKKQKRKKSISKLDGGCLAWTVVASSFMLSFVLDGFRSSTMCHPQKKYYVPPQITKIIVSFPRHELHIEDVPSQLHCFWLFLSKRCIFQLLLWHHPAHHCQSFQSWSRRGSAHLLNFSISPPWIRSAFKGRVS